MAKVLLVDDEPKILRSLSIALEDDHDIYTAVSGSEAKDTIRNKGPFDVVISDQLMPGIKGDELLNWCRRKAPNTKRMILTGLPMTDALKAQLDKNTQATVLTKPCSATMINHAIMTAPVTPAPREEPVKQKKNRKVKKIVRKLAVFDTTMKDSDVYKQLEGQYFDEVCIQNTLRLTPAVQAACDGSQAVVVNLINADQLGYLNDIADHFNQARVRVALSPKMAREVHAKGWENEKIKWLLKPFSLRRLVLELTEPKPDKGARESAKQDRESKPSNVDTPTIW